MRLFLKSNGSIFRGGIVVLLVLLVSLCVEAAHPKKIILFSGTFDPPHMGHEGILEQALDYIQPDLVHVLVNVDPPHKPTASPFHHRLEMSKLAFSHFPHVRVGDQRLTDLLKNSDVEAVKTQLSLMHPDATIYQIMGDDAYEKIIRKPELSFPDNFVFVVFNRDPKDAGLWRRYLDKPVLTLIESTHGRSSTLARAHLAMGQSPHLLDPSVIEYIMAHPDLYQSEFQCERALTGGPAKIILPGTSTKH